ncbi:hypothetical protein BY996DRAFT_6410424 [Phakopsora pachyrhizi]|uniref:Uncharacterized protein n=1 Tax=Phakopsora pachyrhizi TaxID=170000 RepID=A0AAV0BEE1_PHAPC|nr:hypothetical protein BY996DRAFT_6410424 [Phakopsora pachyrhizi]CAH7685180.1 hypothetical protein PPACK8108_LOCUS19663 [Phakopsora pachyrhizi]
MIKSQYRSLLKTYLKSSSCGTDHKAILSSLIFTGLNRSLREFVIRSNHQAVSPPSSSSSSTQSNGCGIDKLNILKNYLISSDLHQQLVKRYNPATDLTEPERLNATVNRVGLSMPKSFKPPPSFQESRKS